MVTKIAAIGNLSFWIYVLLSFFEIDLGNGANVQRDFLVSYLFALILIAILWDIAYLFVVIPKIKKQIKLKAVDYFNIVSFIVLILLSFRLFLFNLDLV